MDTRANRYPRGVVGSYGGVIHTDDTNLKLNKVFTTEQSISVKAIYLYCTISHDVTKVIIQNNIKLSNDLDVNSKDSIDTIKNMIRIVEDPTSSNSDKEVIKNAAVSTLSCIFDTLVIRSTSNCNAQLYNEIKEVITKIIGGYFDDEQQ